MLTCDGARRLISPYLDGELVGEDRTAFQAHVDFCPACRRVLADEEAVVDAVRRASTLRVPPSADRTAPDRAVRELLALVDGAGASR